MNIQGDLLAADGINRAEANADPDWITCAKRALWRVIQRGEPFTSDAVWTELATLTTKRPHEPRALGAVLKAASQAGWITASGDYFKSERPESHSRPVCLWLPQRKVS